MARPVRFNVTPIKADPKDNIALADMPEGYSGEGFFATKFSDVVGLARKNSIWPLPFATSCCGIEFMATMGSHYDLARFGAERVGFFSPSMRSINGDGNDCKENGPSCKAGIPADGGAALGDGRWCMCMQRRNI